MANLPSVWLHELTWEEVEEYLKDNDIIIWPIGATEQHGPAGTLGVDSFVANALAEDAARRAGVLCVPPLWYGDSAHHLGFAGTLSLRTETLAQVMQDIARSLYKHGFRKILFINGNKSANLPAMLSAAKNLREFELQDTFFAVIDPMKIARGIAPKLKGDVPEHHGGELEISHVWYKFPDMVRPERLGEHVVDFGEVFGPYSHNDLLAGGGDTIDVLWTSADQKTFAPTGQFTSNTAASQDKGRQYHEYQVDVIVRFIEWLRGYQGPIGRVGSSTVIAAG